MSVSNYARNRATHLPALTTENLEQTHNNSKGSNGVDMVSPEAKHSNSRRFVS